MSDKLQKTSDITRNFFSKNVTFALKGFAIILMLFHHLFSCFPDFVEKYRVSSVIFPMNKIMVLSGLSKLCVAIFVFLSAYGMTISLEHLGENKPDRYVKQRYKKLIFGFLFVYLLSILTSFLREDGLTLYFREGTSKGILFMVIDSLGLSNFFNTPTYNETWWYMSVAVLLIFIIPVFVKLYNSFGICVLAVSAMFQYLGLPLTAFTSYLFAMFLGICAAKEKLAFRLEEKLTGKRIPLFLIVNTCAILFLCAVRMKWGFEYWLDAVIALLLSMELFVIMDLVQINLRLLTFLGKHSMNMFLIHTLIFEYYFTDFIYSFKNWALITLALLLTSLGLSMMIEFLKKRLLLILPAKLHI